MVLLAFIFFSAKNDDVVAFTIGNGYQNDGYDLNAIQPTSTNWTKQSQFIGSDHSNLYWIYKTGRSVETSPVIAEDGTLYVASFDKLYALNPDGSEKWTFPIGGVYRASPVIGSDGTIYIGSTTGYLYAVDPDGNEKWNVYLNKVLYGSPALASDGTVYIVANGKLYAVDSTGIKKWEYTPSYYNISNSPIVATDGTIYIGGYQKFEALSPEGTQKWEFSLTNSPSTATVGPDGTLYVSDTDTLYALTPDGEENWSYQSPGGGFIGNPALGANNLIYIPVNIINSNSSGLYVLNTSGEFQWTYSIRDISQDLIIDTEGSIYVGSGFGYFYAIRSDGTTKWKLSETFSEEDYRFVQTEFEYSAPAIGENGTIYVGNNKGLYAIGPNGEATSIVVDQPTLTLPIGGSEKVNIFAIFSGGETPNITSWKDVSFQSSNANVAKANKYGVIAVGEGTATITVTFEDTITQIEINVPSNPLFTQNNQSSGFQDGAYDQGALQPSTFNWTRQTRFTVGEDPVKKWISAKHFEVGYQFTSPVIGADGTIYVATIDNYLPRRPFLYAVNPDGTEKWRAGLDAYIVDSPVIGADGTIYMATYNTLFAINPDGSTKWAHPVETIMTSPAIGEDGTIYFGILPFGNDGMGDGGFLYAVTSDGQFKWSYQVGMDVVSQSPAISKDGTIYVANSTGELYAINNNGTLKWKYALEESGDYFLKHAPVITSSGNILVSSLTRGLINFNEDGTIKWELKDGVSSYDHAPAIGADGTIYITSYNNLKAITADGKLLWKYVGRNSNSSFKSPLIDLNDMIYVIDSFSITSVYQDGTERWYYPLDSNNLFKSNLAIGSDNTLYAGYSGVNDERLQASYLYAIQAEGDSNLLPVLTPDLNGDGWVDIYDISQIAKDAPELLDWILQYYGEKADDVIILE
ncbi:outer membrane protein assembly factor BamB family protein [Bacillus sp. Marseille-P3661]|uniref:outer membrane protein assembly factor BamB family protein n=1 Tax=Bacillus sp. Marseille-P3661 TaxID=1936234 RepID=UPI0015E16EB7|nr:PQQ-binding-like beta-propeller repeat protein [Bacillus sp. Marseille-P3661]